MNRDQADRGAASGSADASSGISRRELLQRAAAVGLTTTTFPAFLAACGGGGGGGGGGARRGGMLRVAIVGAGNAETLDPNLGNPEIDVFRTRALFEGLTEYDSSGKTVNQLAAEFSPNGDASVWTIKLRSDVLFHDGKPLTADDVVYSLKYMLEPKNKSGSLTLLSPVLRPSGIAKVDKLTVKLELVRPHSLLPDVLGERTMKIFPDGSTAKELGTKPIGTGPFRFESWTRGERSLFVRNPHWSARGAFGPAHVEGLEIIEINEATSRLNALIAGQVDVVADVGARLADTVKNNGKLKLVDAKSASWTAFYMNCRNAPFDDPQVREAFKLLVDREQMISSALSGKGMVGNDLPSWFDPNYASDIPQREHDPEKAAALLKRAGKGGLAVTLATADAGPAMLDSATLLVEQAKAAGVTVKLQKLPSDQYYDKYPRVPWGQDYWGGHPVAPMYQYTMLKASPFDLTQWDDKGFTSLFFDALKTVDEGKRKNLLVEAQHRMWQDGGFIIWGFPQTFDATSSKVAGLEGNPIRPLNYYDLSHVSFTS